MSGNLNPGADPVRTFIDTFPAGTLSGASRSADDAEKKACRNGGSLNKELGAMIASLDEYPDA